MLESGKGVLLGARWGDDASVILTPGITKIYSEILVNIS